MKSTVVGIAACLGLAALAVAAKPWEPAAIEADAARPTSEPAHVLRDAGRWLAVGGGSIPEMNQVSLEHDLRLASEVLGGGGTLLFAGGPGAHGVQVLRQEPGEAVLLELGEIFQPRGGRDTRYQPIDLEGIAGPSTAAVVTHQLERDLRLPGEPYLMLFSGHGGFGEVPADNHIYLWGGEVLTAHDLAVALQRAQRPVRLVVAACYSGGFAEIAFEDADPERGAPASPHCGLFASTWDRESSGCDPDPDRRQHEGYAVHFLQALVGRDREGELLAEGAVDYNGDGKISLLEAHTRVRIASDSFDIPTSTSERWLRAMVSDGGPAAAVSLPEEDAVIAALADGRSAESIRLEWDDLETRILELDDALAAADLEVEEAYRVLAADLLARWPVLDDPYHPDFRDTVATHRAEIAGALAGWPSAQTVQKIRVQSDLEGRQRDDLQRSAARLERVVRAQETRRLAGLLKAQGGPAWRRYTELLGCERGQP